MKNKELAGFLALFLGGLGVHKFYLGKKSGLWYLLFCWTIIPAFIGIFDAVGLFGMKKKDFDLKYNR